MSLINRDSALKQVLQMLARIEPPAGIDILSYKRDRSVSLLVRNDGRIEVRERGYLEHAFVLLPEEVAKTLKIMLKREFPRSRKVRIFRLTSPDELERDRNIL